MQLVHLVHDVYVHRDGAKLVPERSTTDCESEGKQMPDLLSRLRPTLGVEVQLERHAATDELVLTIRSQDDKAHPLQSIISFAGGEADRSDILAVVDRFLDVWMMHDDRKAHGAAQRAAHKRHGRLWR